MSEPAAVIGVVEWTEPPMFDPADYPGELDPRWTAAYMARVARECQELARRTRVEQGFPEQVVLEW